MCAVNVWKALPMSTTGKTTSLSEVKQKLYEAYEDFLSRLIQAVRRVINNEETADLLIKQENANTSCRSLLRSLRKTGSLKDFVKQCTDVGPASLEGIAITAALKGKTLSSIYNKYDMKGR